jgi:hypothetical protein
MAGSKRKQPPREEPAEGETGARDGRPDEPQRRAPEADEPEATEDELPHH